MYSLRTNDGRLLKIHFLATMTGLLTLGGFRLGSSLLALATTTIIARYLTPTDVGVLSIVVGSCGYLTLVSECGLKSVAMSEGSLRGSVASVFLPYLRTRLLLSIGLTPLAILVAILYFPGYSAIAIPVLMSLMVLPFHVDWILLMNRDYHAAGWATSSRWIFYFVLIGGVSYTRGLTLPVVAILFTLSWALAAIASCVVVSLKKINLKILDSTHPIAMGKLFALGWPVLGLGLITQMMLNADLLCVGATIGTAGAGIYYVACAIITAGLVLANALNQIVLSRYGALKSDPGAFNNQLRSDLPLVTCISMILALGTIYVLPSLITEIFGDTYRGSAQLVVFLAPYLVAYHIYAFSSACCVSLGIQRKVLYGLSSMIVVIPITFVVAAGTGSLVAFAYGKCFLFTYAAAVLIKAIPCDYRAGIWKHFAFSLALIFLIVLWLAPELGHYEMGV